MAVHDGLLVIAGDFTEPMDGIAAWNGESLVDAYPGHGPTRMLEIWDGRLTASDPMSVWDGEQWLDLGAESLNELQDIRVLDGDLYACCLSGELQREIASFGDTLVVDGVASPLLRSPNSSTSDGDGSLARYNDVGDGMIYRWNGLAWETVLKEQDFQPHRMLPWRDRLVIAGSKLCWGGLSAHGVTSWTPNGLRPLVYGHGGLPWPTTSCH